MKDPHKAGQQRIRRRAPDGHQIGGRHAGEAWLCLGPPCQRLIQPPSAGGPGELEVDGGDRRAHARSARPRAPAFGAVRSPAFAPVSPPALHAPRSRPYLSPDHPLPHPQTGVGRAAGLEHPVDLPATLHAKRRRRPTPPLSAASALHTNGGCPSGCLRPWPTELELRVRPRAEMPHGAPVPNSGPFDEPHREPRAGRRGGQIRGTPVAPLNPAYDRSRLVHGALRRPAVANTG